MILLAALLSGPFLTPQWVVESSRSNAAAADARATPASPLQTTSLPPDRPLRVFQAENLSYAGLVIRDSAGRVTYAWIPFAEDEINGIDLLERSGIPVVTAGFGALGEGVCSIGGEGCDLAQCRRTVCQSSAADAPYWQYFEQDPRNPALWEWQPLGASATNVRDGDVFGWSWTGSDPGLPALPAAEIARLAGAGNGAVDKPALRTLLPEGVAAMRAAPPPELSTVVAAAAILVAIGGAALGLTRWRRAMDAAW